MRTKLLLLAILTVFTGLSVAAETQDRDVPPFSEIALRVSGTLYLEQGDQQSVRIETDESTLEEIITEVKGRTLNIRFKTNNFIRRPFNAGKIEIYVTVPEIDAVTVSGSGSVVSSSIKSRIIDLSVSGSGDISIDNLSAETVKAAMSGSGNIRLNKGKSHDLTASISGSGNFRASDFQADNVDTRISGSGSCTVTANSTLKARVSGSGSVAYKGSPQIDTAVSGSGKVKKL